MALKEIPGSAGFLADEEGNVYTPTGEKRNTYRNGDGYIGASVLTEDGRWVTIGVQRLIALAHIERTRADRIQVNHRDSNVENNRAGNLEWVTPSENNIHSEIMRLTNLYPTIVVRNIMGPLGMYRNAHEAAGDLNVTPLEIWDSIKDGKEVDGLMFTHRPFSGTRPVELAKPNFPTRNRLGAADARSIKTLDIDTGDIKIFTSFAEAAKEYGVSASHLHQSIPKPGQVRVFKKKYQVAYANEQFPEITLDDLEKARNHGAREVIAYNVELKKYVICSSAKEFIETYDLSKKAVTTSLAKGVLREIDSWIAVYMSAEGVARLKAYLESPVPK